MLISQRIIFISLLLLMTACQHISEQDIKKDWQVYQSRFISADGRVIDTGNGSVSHSEGQGYGLILAVKNHDQANFQKIWQWTKSNLQVRQDQLFMWRKRQDVDLKDEDMNNATDGDMLIAWALLEAGKLWQQPEYRKEAEKIIADVKLKLIKSWNGLDVVLPGEFGFNHEGVLVINLSYWIYPAFENFSKTDNDPIWHKLMESGRIIMEKARYGRWQLPPDWLQLNIDNSMEPIQTKRFGYDAVRVPLYLLLNHEKAQNLTAFADFWAFYQPYTPAWIALNENIMDSYGASDGIQAIKKLTLWRAGRTDSIEIKPLNHDQDYYSSTLLLLSKISYLLLENQ
jgi:endoglucanase